MGLNVYDYHARVYDPAAPRFWQIDPLAEKAYSTSPYVYCYNNPLTFVDPTGMQADGWITQVIDGTTSHTFDAKVNTVEEATAAGYSNVQQVSQSATVSNSTYGYSYNLNVDGSVTNADGNNIQFHKPIQDGAFTIGAAFETQGGSKIYTSNLGEGGFNNLPKASGAVESMEFSSPFFAWGAVLKPAFGALLGSSASTTGRVFWSGGEIAKGAAAEFAAANGMKTLEMTTRGGLMNTISPFLPRSVSNPIWNNLSTNFAKGASGEVNFFTTAAGPRPSSIWLNVEKPILQSNGVNIITNTVK